MTGSTTGSAAKGPARAIDRWRLLRACAAEPYRLLFPLGLIHLLVGIGAWVVHSFSGGGSPLLLHLGLTVQGFLLCFVLGFLGTMVPNLLDAPRAGSVWLVTVIAVILLAFGGVVAESPLLMSLGLVGGFLALPALGLRSLARGRRLPPPPQMGVVAVAVLAALAAVVVPLLPRLGIALPGWLSLWSYRMQTQGVLLLLSLGIGGLLLPRLAAGAGADPGAMAGARAGLRWYLLHAGLGLAFVASFAIETVLAGQPAEWIAAAGRIVLALILAWPALVAGWRVRLPLYLRAAQLSLFSMVLGLLLGLLLPTRAIAWHHLIYITGFLLLTLMIAARVCTAHAGRPELVERGGRWIGIQVVLVVLAVLLRIAADWWFAARAPLLGAASVAGLAAMGVWAWRCLPLMLLIPEPRPLATAAGRGSC